jgi:hypothetical protein
MEGNMRTRIEDLQSATDEGQKLGKRPSPRLSVGLVSSVAILCSVFTPLGFAGQTAQTKPDPEVKILVYNMAEVPRATLTGAEREASHILSKAGVLLRWFECSAGHSDAESRDICLNGWGTLNIGLRILVKPAALNNRFQGNHLGFAIFPALASVYYDRTVRFVGDDRGLGLPTVLGCLIAHEIGHLLLGPNSHSHQGLMQAQWGERQIHQALGGDLFFTSNQAKFIQREARTRMSLQASTFREQRLVSVERQTSVSIISPHE